MPMNGEIEIREKSKLRQGEEEMARKINARRRLKGRRTGYRNYERG